MHSGAHQPSAGICVRGRWPRRAALAVLLAVSGAATAGAPEQAQAGSVATDVSPVGADLADLSLEQLLDVRVSTASRFEQSASDAPSAVRVITAEEIRAFGWRTLADALGSLPGLFSSYDRGYTYLGARGFLRPGDYGSRFLLLVDGHRLNEPIYEQATAGLEFPVGIELIERIEYVPGPGSSVFGSNAFFGVINVITRRGDDHRGAQAAVEAGSNGRRGFSARYGLSGAGGDLLIAASAIDVDGDDLYFPEFDTPETNNGVAVGLDHERVRRLFLKAERGAFGLSLVHSSREKGTPTAAYLQSFNDPRSRESDEWSLLGAHYRARPSATTETAAHVLFGAYDYRGAFAYGAPTDGLSRDIGRARWIGVGAHAVTTALAGHKLVFGVDAQFDMKRDQYSYDESPYASYLADERHALRAGVLIQDEVALREDLLLNAGVRFDHDSVSGGNFSPRVALIQRWSPDATLKLIHGSAYRSPNAYELYYHSGDVEEDGSQLANPALGPERIRSSEIVWSQQLGARTQWQASVYRYRISGLITQVVANQQDSGPLIFENFDRANATGVELSGDHRWRGGASLRASYGYARVKDGGSETPINSPRHAAALNLIVPLAGDRLLAGLEARYLGSRDAEYGPVDAYTLANLTLTWRLPVPGLELQGSVYNLFDERYADPAGPSFVQNAIEQDGRTFLLRATYGF